MDLSRGRTLDLFTLLATDIHNRAEKLGLPLSPTLSVTIFERRGDTYALVKYEDFRGEYLMHGYNDIERVSREFVEMIEKQLKPERWSGPSV